MSAVWVLLELVSLALIVVLVCVAVFVRQRDASPQDLCGEYEEPEWWPEFERDFSLYVAKREATHQHGSGSA